MKRRKERSNLTFKQLEKRLKIANNITNISLILAILGCILILMIARIVSISSKEIMPFYITWAGVWLLIVSISSEVAIKMRERIKQIKDQKDT